MNVKIGEEHFFFFAFALLRNNRKNSTPENEYVPRLSFVTLWICDVTQTHRRKPCIRTSVTVQYLSI